MANLKPIAGYGGEFKQVQSGDLVDPVTLGTGAASSTTALYGDGTWKSVTTGTASDVFAFAAAYG